METFFFHKINAEARMWCNMERMPSSQFSCYDIQTLLFNHYRSWDRGQRNADEDGFFSTP